MATGTPTSRCWSRSRRTRNSPRWAPPPSCCCSRARGTRSSDARTCCTCRSGWSSGSIVGCDLAMSGSPGVFARYPGSARDEAVDPDGAVRPAYAPVAEVLEGLGAVGITAVVGAVAQERRMRGVVFGTFVDGRLQERPFPLCPVPRVLSAADWAHLSRGVEQRTRALNAFLADVYRPGGRRRTDRARHAGVVRAVVVPEWIVSASPGHRPAAVGLAAAGQQR